MISLASWQREAIISNNGQNSFFSRNKFLRAACEGVYVVGVSRYVVGVSRYVGLWIERETRVSAVSVCRCAAGMRMWTAVQDCVYVCKGVYAGVCMHVWTAVQVCVCVCKVVYEGVCMQEWALAWGVWACGCVGCEAGGCKLLWGWKTYGSMIMRMHVCENVWTSVRTCELVCELVSITLHSFQSLYTLSTLHTPYIYLQLCI